MQRLDYAGDGKAEKPSRTMKQPNVSNSRKLLPLSDHRNRRSITRGSRVTLKKLDLQRKYACYWRLHAKQCRWKYPSSSLLPSLLIFHKCL